MNTARNYDLFAKPADKKGRRIYRQHHDFDVRGCNLSNFLGSHANLGLCAMNSQYVIPPPNIPEFIYKSNVAAWLSLIAWANREYKARLRYCAKRGYFKQWIWLHKNSSPIHILAESPKYRKLCALLSQSVWDIFTARERSFIRRSYELRDLILR